MRKQQKQWIDSLNTAWRSVVTPLVNRGVVPIPPPFHLTYVTTRPCNSRCIMCYLWKEKRGNELSVTELSRIFRDNDFTSLTALTLTGGEATLRRDLADLFGVIVAACPKLHQVTLATNALHTKRVVQQVRACLAVIPQNSNITSFSVQVSVDGIGEVHDRIRGIPGYFDRVVETIRQLAQISESDSRLAVKLSCTVQPTNVESLREVAAFAKRRGIPIHFGALVVSSDYYDNAMKAEDLHLTDAQAQQAAEFFSDVARTAPSSNIKFYYRDVAQMVQGAKRTQTCMMGYYSFVLEHDGGVYACVDCEKRPFGNLREHRFQEIWWGALAQNVRNEMRANCCSTCRSACYVSPKDVGQVADIALHRLADRVRWAEG